MAQLFKNNASGKLAAAIDSDDTTIVLETGQGSRFPTLGSGDYFMATFADIVAGREVEWEIVKVTAKVGDTLTIARAQEGTAARGWHIETMFEHRVTADTMNELSVTTVSQAEAEAGTATTARKWTAQRVRQAIVAWWNTKQRRSLYIKRVALLGDSLSDLGNGSATVTNLVQTGGVATATCANHFTLPGSLVHIAGANQGGYNGWHVVTAATPTTIHFAVPADTVSPATTPVVIRVLSQQRITGQSWFAWAASELGGAVQQVLNAGVGGDNTIKAAERVDYIIGTDADTVVVLLGHNDIFWDEAADTDAAFARYVAICERFINAGMRVISPTLISTPLASGVGYVCRQKTGRFNVLLRDWAQSTDGVIYVDLHAAIVDPTSDVAISRANVQASDNVHLSIYGAQLFGAVLADAMRPFVQVHNILPSSALPIAENLCTNPTMRGTGGYVGNASGEAPLAFQSAMLGSGSWVSSIVARTIEADGDDIGNNAVLTTASSTAYDMVIMGTPNVISLVSAGDGLWGCAHIQITNPDAFAGFNFGVYIKRGSDEYWATASEWWGGLEANMNNVNGVFRTPKVTIPSDATFVSFMIMGTVVNAGEAVTVKMGRVGLFKE